MPYKISGYMQDPTGKIIVIKESDWSVETTQDVTIGDYEILGLVAGKKLITAISDEGEVIGFGDVDSIEY